MSRLRRVRTDAVQSPLETYLREINVTALLTAQDEKDLASAYRRLVRAGFRTGDIVRVLKKFAKNPELLDNLEPPEEVVEE